MVHHDETQTVTHHPNKAKDRHMIATTDVENESMMHSTNWEQRNHNTMKATCERPTVHQTRWGLIAFHWDQEWGKGSLSPLTWNLVPAIKLWSCLLPSVTLVVGCYGMYITCTTGSRAVHSWPQLLLLLWAAVDPVGSGASLEEVVTGV